MKLSSQFYTELGATWGNPHSVAEAGMRELFRLPNPERLDHDTQVKLARGIGVLAGRSFGGGGGPTAFAKDLSAYLDVHYPSGQAVTAEAVTVGTRSIGERGIEEVGQSGEGEGAMRL